MSLNGSGQYVVNSSGQPVAANTLITAASFNAFTADIATALSTAIFKDGQQTVTANIPMGGYRFTGLGAGAANGQSLRYEQLFTTSAVTLLGAMDWVKGANIASDTTVNLTTATGNGVHITGTTTITGVTLGSGMWRLVIFDGALTLTHHATNNNLPGGANITTAANDRALYWADGTTVYCVAYQKASGKSTVAPAVGDITGLGTGVATALAVNVGSAGAPVVYNGALGTPSGGDITNLAASQAQQETGTALTVAVTPGRQQYHASAAKAWCYADTGGTVNASYGVSSVTDVGPGQIGFNWTTSFSGTAYCVIPQVRSAGASAICVVDNAGTQTAARSDALSFASTTGAAADPNNWYVVAYGDQ
jgi:hypothetical protein